MKEEESDILHAYDVYFKTVQMRFKDIFAEDSGKGSSLVASMALQEVSRKTGSAGVIS